MSRGPAGVPLRRRAGKSLEALEGCKEMQTSTAERALASKSQGVWASAEAYEPYMGVWSRRVAERFVAWLGVPSGARWLDVGTGTGAVVGAVLEQAQPERIDALDLSPGYLEYARHRHPDGRVVWDVQDGAATTLDSGSVDAATCALTLNFVPDAVAVLREMARVTRPGGTVAAYVWDYGDRMQILRAFWDAAISLDPAAKEKDEAQRSTVWKPEELRHRFHAAGLCRIESTEIELSAQYPSFEQYWAPFLGGQGTVASYAMGLSASTRAQILARLDQSLPRNAQGHIQLAVRAFAVRGELPERSPR